MASWRQTASVEAQRDLDNLLGLMLHFAQKELKKHGEFYPFAAIVGNDGRAAIVGTRTPRGGEHPRSAAVLEECVARLKTKRGQIRAGAMATDVRLPEMGSDAVAVELEHVEGQAITVLLPYRKQRFPAKIEYGPIQAEPGRRWIWVA